MSDSKKGGLKSLVSELVDGAALLFGLIAFCMLFVSCVELTGIYASSFYTGSQIVFGFGGVLSFSFMNFLPFFFVFVAVIIVALNFFGAFKSLDFDVEIIATALFLVAAVLFFWSPRFVQINNGAFSGRKLATGLIMAAMLSILSAIVLGAKQIFDYLVKNGYVKVSE